MAGHGHPDEALPIEKDNSGLEEVRGHKAGDNVVSCTADFFVQA